MNYRKFGKTNFKASFLGFGCMRLPTIGGDPARINIPKAIRMIRLGIDGGINYIDTAWPYHAGESEKVVGLALKNGYREKVKLATKLPIWALEKKKDIDKIFNQQLKKLKTDRIDFYLLHALNEERWQKLNKLDVLSWAKKVQKEGKIRHLGFSFHDNYSVFEKIVNGYDKWTFCQIQYNYLNESYQAGLRGLKYAASKGLAVIIMEPLLGGLLANPPERIMSFFDKTGRNPVQMAFKWLWSQKEVSLVLSGMSNLTQVKQNLVFAGKNNAAQLILEEQKLIQKVKKIYQKLAPIPCTQCEYCLPCPQGINIPANFALYNSTVMHENKNLAGNKRSYMRLPEEKRASNCVNCRICETKCPQKIKISDWLLKVDRKFNKSSL
ncbi:MAG: aldo/keto reductase [Candidatus Pacebacteria bacterium]|nr:aldo/keto reductase [Candidatus Paceibacterota bacterium]